VVLLLGSDELSEGVINAKRMDSGDQVSIPLDDIEETISGILDEVDSVDRSQLDRESGS
jgi:histidyl-tRNA synthetase